MRELVFNPGKDKSSYQCVPFWSWNDELEKERLIEQIEWMKSAGCGGFFMHARGGLKTEYMSEEWMQCIDVCVDAAKRLGMEAWLYDENGWPSGFAGGKLLEDESNRDAYLTYKIGLYDAEAWLVYSLEEVAIRRLYEPEEGQCLNLYLHISPSSVDILNGEVVDKFIQETHEKYAEHFGDEFSEKVAGFFTDEPQYYRWGTAYSRVLPKEMKKRYDIDIYDELGLLFVEKEGYVKFRYRYWLTMQQLMLENYSKKIYDWCEKHGVAFTGHYVEETSLIGQMWCCAGVMPFYEYMHMPGIDWLNRKVGNHTSLRQIASVSAQLGKKHILSETFGCCGWDVTPRELRMIADFQYVEGVNRTCQHLVPYSEHGQRKRDYPSHFSKINPWITEKFEEFNEYYTRLGYLMANSKEPVKVAMLHPMRSAYIMYEYEMPVKHSEIKKLDTIFSQEQEILCDRQIPYHFLDETMLERHGYVKGDHIGCGLCEYEYLIIPTCYIIGKKTEQLLHTYVENGGKVLLMSQAPVYLEGETFDFSYLRSNVTLEDMAKSHPYYLQKPVTSVHSTYRESEQGAFLFVQNYGETPQTVQYNLAGDYQSFEKWDLTTMSSETIGTNVCLDAFDSCILFFSEEKISDKPDKEIIHLNNKAKVLSATENYLTLDTARYSLDGRTFSETLPVTGIFQECLNKRYEGYIYLQTEVEVKDKTGEMFLIVEPGQKQSLWINGQEIEPWEEWERDHQIRRVNITEYVIEGRNVILNKAYFYQSEQVYYALFGEDVTESLRNCLAYDTEMESMYLAGDFGVYMRRAEAGDGENIVLGEDFYIGAAKKEVTDLIFDGYPFFSGKITLQQELWLDETNVELEFVGRFQTANVWVNGKKAGSLLLNKRIDISPYSQKGENEVVIELTVSNRNMLGPHHNKEYEEPYSVGPYTFELPETWMNGKSNAYRKTYSFVKVPIF